MPGAYNFFYFLRHVFLAAAFFLPFFLNAQLCNGSLGDPVVNITFENGYGSNFLPPAAYTYTNSSCPNDGYYTITNATSACFGNSWHTVNSDHTGNGSFMLLNASYQPGDFFVTTVTGLCPNTTYEFASWIMNVLISPTGIKPNVTFTIETPDGTILNQFNTGGIDATPQPVWKQYGFFFTTSPINPVIVLRMTNNAPGGIGNDLALDDITFRPCGPVLNASVQGNPDKLDVCSYEQSNYTFNATISAGYISPVHQWQLSTDSGLTWKDISGANILTYQRSPSSAGRFLYRLTVAESGNGGISSCRIGSNILTINVHARPYVNAGPDRVVVLGNSTSLIGKITGETPVYAWSPPDFLSSISAISPTLTPDRDLLYKLTAISSYGCTNQDYVGVKIVAGIFVPTAFTPNNDGKNDTWQIPYLDPLLGVTVSVYNRYGQLVYQVTGKEVNWNGTYNGIPQSGGTYVYIISFKKGQAAMKGTVTIIR